jgi:hypothetical protein
LRYGDLEPLAPSHPADREMLEAMLASEREADDASITMPPRRTTVRDNPWASLRERDKIRTSREIHRDAPSH